MRKVMGDQRLTHFNSDEKVSCTLCLYELKNLSWVYRKRLSEQSLYYIWKFCTDSNRDFSATMMIFCKTPVSVLWFAYYNIKHMNWIADALSLSSYPIVKCSCLRNKQLHGQVKRSLRISVVGKTCKSTEVYEEPCKTSKTELLAKIVNGYLTGFRIRL